MASRSSTVMARLGSSGPAHSGTGAGTVEGEPALLDQGGDHRLEHRLGHRPAEQGRVRADDFGRPVEVLEPAPVALGHQPPPVHDDDGEGAGQGARLVEHRLEQGLEVDPGRRVALGPAVGRPRGALGLGREGDERPGARAWSVGVRHGPKCGPPAASATPSASSAPVPARAVPPGASWRGAGPPSPGGPPLRFGPV